MEIQEYMQREESKNEIKTVIVLKEIILYPRIKNRKPFLKINFQRIKETLGTYMYDNMCEKFNRSFRRQNGEIFGENMER